MAAVYQGHEFAVGWSRQNYSQRTEEHNTWRNSVVQSHLKVVMNIKDALSRLPGQPPLTENLGCVQFSHRKQRTITHYDNTGPEQRQNRQI